MGWKYNSAPASILAALAVSACAAQEPAAWRDAPAFVALFAPVDARAGAYRASVSAADLETVIRAFAADPTLSRAPGAWVPQPLSPLDAFGQTGRYDRGRLARLYGGRRPRVARGTRLDGGRTIEAWTLISPYPDPELRRLEAGTLLVVFRYDFLTE